MGRNGILGCCCPCFSSGNRAPSSSDMINDFNFSDTDTEIHPSTIQHDVPSYNLVPLPPHRAFPDHANTASSAATEIHPSTIQHEVPSCKLVPLPRDRAFPDHAIGIDDQVNSVIRLLEWEDETNAAVAVILHGFGGTGKTTLADAVVAKLNIQGWNCSTVVPFQSIENFEEGQREIQNAEQAFIYIDNALVRGEHIQKLLLINSFKKLRLLLTARDEMIADVILGCGVHTHVYPVSHLLPQDAMEFLCNKMGLDGRMQIPQDHMSQIDEILKICDGVPVVLERVGAYISQTPDKDEAYRRLIEWSKNGKPFSTAEEYSIEKKGLLFDLEEIPPSAREAFLDICSFFNGWDWDKVSCIMGEEDLTSLTKLALLSKKEESENKVMVHPIILTVGRNMTTGTRFTSAHDLSQALDGNELGIQGIKGIWLKDNTSEPFLLSAKKLDLMHNSLRVLSLGDMTIVLDGQYCRQKFKQIIFFEAGLIPNIPFHPTTLEELRFLDWLPDQNNDLQLAKMSSKLKVLNLCGLRYSRAVYSADDFSRLRGLRTLILADFETLETLPDELSLLTQLEELDLSNCSVRQLPNKLGNLEALTKLNLRSCWCLQELPDSFGKLRSLKYLDLHHCVQLKRLPEDFGSLSSLEELDLGSGYLEELPSSFEKLSSLKVLNLMYCSRIKYLPDNIGNLSALVRLELDGSGLLSIPRSIQRLTSFPVSVSMKYCPHLRDLPEEFCSYLKLVEDLSFQLCHSLANLPKRLVKLASLTRLDLQHCNILERLPEGFGELKSLAVLNLVECTSLERLPEGFGELKSLVVLNLVKCTSLERLPEGFGELKSLAKLNIIECSSLERLPEGFGQLKSLVKLNLVDCTSLDRLPEDFSQLISLVKLSLSYCISLKKLPVDFGQLKSLAKLNLTACTSLERLPQDFSQLKSLAELNLAKCTSFERLPEGLGQLKSLTKVNVKECYSLQQLSADFHCLASLQSLDMRECTKLDGKWMDSVGKIRTLDLVDIAGSEMLVKRWTELEVEKEEEPRQFAVRTDRQKTWKNVDNMLSKAASKLFTGKCLLTDSHKEPFSLSTVAPNTLLLVIYEDQSRGSSVDGWQLREEFVMRHEHPLVPFQMIYVGKYFSQLPKKFADTILAHASKESDAFSLFYNALEVTTNRSSFFSLKFVLTEVAEDAEGRKHFSRWEDITESSEDFFLSKSRLCSDVQKLTETPQESNDKLLRTLFNTAESNTNAVFIKNYTENIGVDQLRGKTVLLLISFLDEHPFQDLTEIYSKLKTSDNLEILSIPIPQMVSPKRNYDLALFESILRNVPWPVLRNPWLFKAEVYENFFRREWGELIPGILVVVDPNGRILNKNALPLVKRWGAEVYPFTDEKMKQLEQEIPEEHLSEYILNGLFDE